MTLPEFGCESRAKGTPAAPETACDRRTVSADREGFAFHGPTDPEQLRCKIDDPVCCDWLGTACITSPRLDITEDLRCRRTEGIDVGRRRHADLGCAQGPHVFLAFRRQCPSDRCVPRCRELSCDSLSPITTWPMPRFLRVVLSDDQDVPTRQQMRKDLDPGGIARPSNSREPQCRACDDVRRVLNDENRIGKGCQRRPF